MCSCCEGSGLLPSRCWSALTDCQWGAQVSPLSHQPPSGAIRPSTHHSPRPTRASAPTSLHCILVIQPAKPERICRRVSAVRVSGSCRRLSSLRVSGASARPGPARARGPAGAASAVSADARMRSAGTSARPRSGPPRLGPRADSLAGPAGIRAMPLAKPPARPAHARARAAPGPAESGPAWRSDSDMRARPPGTRICEASAVRVAAP